MTTQMENHIGAVEVIPPLTGQPIAQLQGIRRPPTHDGSREIPEKPNHLAELLLSTMIANLTLMTSEQITQDQNMFKTAAHIFLITLAAATIYFGWDKSDRSRRN